MKKYTTLVLLIIINFCFSQTPLTINWEENFGGEGFDESWSIVQTNDGGYIMAGRSTSTSGQITQSYGGQDFIVVKTDANGQLTWLKKFGGSGLDHAYDIKQDHQNNYIIVGYTNSINGQITNFYGNLDVWVIKIDNFGNLIWQKSIGTSVTEYAHSVELTHDNDGYIISGSSTLNQQSNVLVIRIDLNGNVIWQNIFVSTSSFSRDIIKTNDGNYALIGGGLDFRILKISPSGSIIWEFVYGGSLNDEPNRILQTSDGGFIVVGATASNDGDVLNHYGLPLIYDGWIVKLNQNGILEWSKNIGGTGEEEVYGVVEVCDGYIVSGYSNSTNNDISNNIGEFDVYVSKISFNGDIIWTKNYGSPAWDFNYDMILNNNNEVVLTGRVEGIGGDVTNHFNPGGNDIWLVKFNVENCSINIPNGNSTQTFCDNATIADLVVSGTNIIWYDSSSLTNPLDSNTQLIHGATYYATQGNNCCRSSFLSVTVNIESPITPIFTQVSDICSGTTLSELPTTSNNGIIGTWSPSLNNSTTTTYSFTPDAGQCATTATMTITVNSNINPTFTQVAPICEGNTLISLPTISNNGITGTWSPTLNNTSTTTYTFTPDTGQCASIATMTITVNPNVTPSFTQVTPICSGTTLSALPTISNNGITGTWSPALNNLTTTTYTFTPDSGQCATIATMTISVNSDITPTFTQIAPICSGTTLSALPTISNEGIAGTWAPTINNIATTTYTFTPDAGQCATTTTMTITVNPNISPTFTQVAPICSGTTLSTLPTISNNGITGTWSPSLNNTSTTTYTFTPDAGQCATTTNMIISVYQGTNPLFIQVPAICSGATLSALPTTSNNGITGTWTPALNNTATTTYTFTPTAGQCATIQTMTITVNPYIIPTFTQVTPICEGTTLNALPTTSNNGITGTWSPALDNTATTTYTFTPDAGQCASNATMTITINPLPLTPTGNAIQSFCAIDNPTVNDLVVSGTNILWYQSASGGIPLSLNFDLIDGMTLYASSLDIVTNCENPTRFPVTIQVENPTLPSISSEQVFCLESNLTLADINTNGVVVNWYDNAIGGNLVPLNQLLNNGDIYYGASVSSNSGCESTIRIPIEITIIDSNLSFFNLITIDDNDLNKELIIQGIEQFPNNSIEIYNRYGNLVWSGVNYNNVTNTFKGMANVSGVVSQGSYLPTGTYFFILSYPNDCEKSELKGFIQIDNKR